MKRSIWLLSLSLLGVPSLAQTQRVRSERPKIFGIALVRLRASDLEASRRFYHTTVGLYPLTQGCFSPMGAATCYYISQRQQIEILSDSTPSEPNAVESVGFQVGDTTQMRTYLTVRGIKCGQITNSNSGDKFFEVFDPEDHHILFISLAGKAASLLGYPGDSYLIHAGFIVHDRTAIEHFYKDILGFRPYWHGGMKDDQTDWVSMQVPDGTDWLEFMVNVPSEADQKLRGIMNHIALGVPDIHAAEKQLRANGWRGTEQPKIGRDGKWQLNLYDPDDTRIEFMEFTPVQKPCCSEFTGPHPKP